MTSDRKHIRIETDALLDFTGSQVLLFHRIENISLGGLSIVAAEVEPIGTQVHLVITFRDMNLELETDGEVVWSRNRDPKEMGIRFTALTQDQEDLLQKYTTARKKALEAKLKA